MRGFLDYHQWIRKAAALVRKSHRTKQWYLLFYTSDRGLHRAYKLERNQLRPMFVTPIFFWYVFERLFARLHFFIQMDQPQLVLFLFFFFIILPETILTIALICPMPFGRLPEKIIVSIMPIHINLIIIIIINNNMRFTCQCQTEVWIWGTGGL